MHDTLITYIQKHSEQLVSEQEALMIKDLFVYKKLRKRQFLMQEGDVCHHMAFVIKGALRQYTVDDKGAEHIVGLMLEEWWAGDRESFFKSTPTIYNIDAWEETELLLLPKEHLAQVNSIPAFMQMRIKLDENFSISAQKRLLSTLSQPAEYRYEELTKKYPDFLQRFPQHIIASYLGITKETLSRIRNKAVKR